MPKERKLLAKANQQIQRIYFRKYSNFIQLPAVGRGELLISFWNWKLSLLRTCALVQVCVAAIYLLYCVWESSNRENKIRRNSVESGGKCRLRACVDFAQQKQQNKQFTNSLMQRQCDVDATTSTQLYQRLLTDATVRK